jgi:hypothetical protein
MLTAKLLGVSALAIVATCGVALAQQAQHQTLPEGRVYSFHSPAPVGRCNALDWHLVVGPDNTLTGMISWDNMKNISNVSGTVNLANRSFQANAMRPGGRGAKIDGQITPEGWLIANIKGPNVDCPGIRVHWFVPPPAGD